MSPARRLAIITTHPIQYYAPVFERLANDLHVKVFYTLGNEQRVPYDQGFLQTIKWDIPLLDGYDYEFLDNIAKKPGSHKFCGINNPKIIESIENYKPTSILVYGWAYKSHLQVIRHFYKKVPLLFRGDSTLLDKSGRIRAFLKTQFLRWLYSKISIAFFVGTQNKLYFSKYGLTEEQLIFAPHAVDNNRFSTANKDAANLIRKNLNVHQDDMLILFAGKMEPKKAPELLIQAISELAQGNVHLLMVGNGELELSLKNKVGHLHLDSHIHFMPFQNQQMMPAIYQCCDLFCLPSKGPSETWGLSINEAMAAGKAILASDAVGCAMDLVNDDNGGIFRHGDIGHLKKKIRALTSSKDQLIKMGQVSLSKIESWNMDIQSKTIAENVHY